MGLVIHQAKELPPPNPAEKFQLRAFDEVDYEPVHFLACPYIPLGKLTIVQGDSGVGKTAVICKVAAAVSVGGVMQGTPCVEGNVLMLSVEDDPSTLRGRIEASGGDVKRVLFIDNAHELHFMHPAIGPLIEKSKAKLVVFDPIQAFMGGKIDMFRANETRPILAHLAAMAKEHDCAILLISHMSKGSAGSRAVYRALGSVDIVGACRSLLYVGRNPRDPEQCAIVHCKSSNAPKGKTILYRIGDRGGVTWEGYSDITEHDLESQGVADGTPIIYQDDPLVQFLRQVVEENPEGVFLTWSSFNRYSVGAMGERFGADGREIKSRMGSIVTDLARRDGIYLAYKDTARETEHIECGMKVEACDRGRGVFINRRDQPDEIVI